MSEMRTGELASSAIRRVSSDAAGLGPAGWLSLAAAPAFVIMALLSETRSSGPADILCSAAHEASPLNGMTLMYGLMSVFHSAPWLKLLSRKRTAAPRYSTDEEKVGSIVGGSEE
jgi:hypothetical protein